LYCIDQLLQDIDTPGSVQSVPDTDTSASSAGMPPFQPQAASMQQHSFATPDVSPPLGHARKLLSRTLRVNIGN